MQIDIMGVPVDLGADRRSAGAGLLNLAQQVAPVVRVARALQQ